MAAKTSEPPASQKPRKGRADHLRKYRIQKGQVLNPKGRPSGYMRAVNAVQDFIYHTGEVKDDAGNKYSAFEVLMRGWLKKAVEDIEFARLLLSLLVGKEADGHVPGLEGQGKTLIRRERLLEIFREAASDDMKLIDVRDVAPTSGPTKEGGNGDGLPA